MICKKPELKASLFFSFYFFRLAMRLIEGGSFAALGALAAEPGMGKMGNRKKKRWSVE